MNQTYPALIGRLGVARLLGVTEQTVTNWARQGALPVVEIAGRNFYEAERVERMARERRPASGDPAIPR